MEKKRRKIKKGMVEIENGRTKSYKMRRRPFFFFSFLSFFFCFSLFKTTQICLRSTKMGIFYWEKAFYTRKKFKEKWLCPLWKIFLLCPWILINPWSSIVYTQERVRNPASFLKSGKKVRNPASVLCKLLKQGWIKWFLPREQGFKVKIFLN